MAQIGTFTFNVQDFGATGNGVTDDTAAFRSAIQAALASLAGTVYIPGGAYRITSSLNLSKGSAPSRTQVVYDLSLIGEGKSSIIHHSFDGPLLQFNDTAGQVTVASLNVVSDGPKTTATSVPFYFPLGNFSSEFRGVSVSPGTTNPAGFYFCAANEINDTVTFTDVLIQGITQQGITIGRGSSIFFNGGRIIGNQVGNSAIGINLTGGNGGIYLSNLDIIQCYYGLYVSAYNGMSNREIFLSNVTLDSCKTGLNAIDDAYISWQGVWAASCDINIQFAPLSDAGILHLNGGTLFNAGQNLALSQFGIGLNHSGLGRFQLVGVLVRNNKGGGVIMQGNTNKPCLVLGCDFYENGPAGNFAFRANAQASVYNIFE